MTTERIAKILVPVDFSNVTALLVERASQFARAFGSKVRLLTVVEAQPQYVGFEPGPMTMPPPPFVRDPKIELDRLETLRQSLPGLDVSVARLEGPSVETILAECDAQNADLIIIGSHGHGALFNLLVGSVASGVLKSSRCPVLVVPSPKS
jgi:nucleotide-binding universal stress UspA family protein